MTGSIEQLLQLSLQLVVVLVAAYSGYIVLSTSPKSKILELGLSTGLFFVAAFLMELRRITAWMSTVSPSSFIATLDNATIPLIITIVMVGFSVSFALLIRAHIELLQHNTVLSAELSALDKDK